MGQNIETPGIWGKNMGNEHIFFLGTTWETTMNAEEKHRKKSTWTTYN